MGAKAKETKVCLRCKRFFTNRKSWSSRGQWEQVVYCSERCRKGIQAEIFCCHSTE